MANDNGSLDLRDSSKDAEKLKADKGTIDLPDVSDIPGQEHIHVPSMGELADTTISSADEEGEGLFEDDEEDQIVRTTGNIDPSSKDDNDLRRSLLDTRDNEGEKLNEQVNVSGSDLDTSGIDEDDANESIGEEDEENNHYSLGSDSEQEENTRG